MCNYYEWKKSIHNECLLSIVKIIDYFITLYFFLCIKLVIIIRTYYKIKKNKLEFLNKLIT